MFLAETDTGSFNWKAFGATKDEAVKALAQGFERHLKGRDSSKAQWRDEVGGDYKVGTLTQWIAALSDWYGINVTEVVSGVCYRDGFPV